MQCCRSFPLLFFVAIFGSLAPRGAGAQDHPGCAAPQQGVAGTLVIQCRRVKIEIEDGASATLVDRDKAGEPRAVLVKSGAVYIQDRAGGSGFQVRTPDAIASVRGTEWAVDVGGARSSVFVVTGIVQVQRRLDRQGVRLAAGEGVDVEADTGPLVVKRWAVPRVRALLGRFGR